MTNPGFYLALGVILAVLGTKFNSFGMWGLAVALFFWAGVLYAL